MWDVMGYYEHEVVKQRLVMRCDVFLLPTVYHALYLEELTLLDLSEKIAMLYSIGPQQITHVYRQKPTGIHIVVSDEVSMKHSLLTPSDYSQYLDL